MFVFVFHFGFPLKVYLIQWLIIMNRTGGAQVYIVSKASHRKNNKTFTKIDVQAHSERVRKMWTYFHRLALILDVCLRFVWMPLSKQEPRARSNQSHLDGYNFVKDGIPNRYVFINKFRAYVAQPPFCLGFVPCFFFVPG